jgi:hypothetical protein
MTSISLEKPLLSGPARFLGSLDLGSNLQAVDGILALTFAFTQKKTHLHSWIVRKRLGDQYFESWRNKPPLCYPSAMLT